MEERIGSIHAAKNGIPTSTRVVVVQDFEEEEKMRKVEPLVKGVMCINNVVVVMVAVVMVVVVVVVVVVVMVAMPPG